MRIAEAHGDHGPADDGCLGRRPERLVVRGLRGWLWGYATADIACWEAVWNEYAGALGPEPAKAVVGELSAWARVLHRTAGRDIACHLPPCRWLCRDECLALGLVAGCQLEAWAAAEAAARALVGPGRSEAVLESGRGYAAAMAAVGQRLDGESVFGLVAVDPAAARALH